MMQSNRPTVFRQAWGIGLLGLAVAAAPASGALVAHYTLDSTTTGLQNTVAGGSDSNLSLYSGSDDAGVTSGIIGSALSFNGSIAYTATASGNAADNLSGFPISFSIWVSNITDTAGADAVISISQRGVTGTYFTLGFNADEVAQVVRRYNSGNTASALGPSVAGSQWHNVIGVITGATPAHVTLYVDGAFAANTNNGDINASFTTAIDTLTLGGISRTLDGNPNLAAPFTGDLDDAGLFSHSLGSADAALINGLGRLAGLGLDWHEQGRSLHDSALDTIMTLGTYQWQRVDGLSGSVGDIGGTVAGGDAYIITAVGGHGIKMVPEPAFAGGLFAAGMLLMRRARARA